jgi:uncharacterized membrane protein
MTSLVLAALFFLGIHVFVSGTRLRGAIVGTTGEKGFQALFSLLSLVGIVWMCRAYGQTDEVELWGDVGWFHPVGFILMIAAFLLVALGLLTPSPTVSGGESQLDRDEPAQGILRITRHPFLWGVAIWAFAHLVSTGDLASLVLFGSFLALALAGPPLIDAKRQATCGDRWDRFAAVTSSVPFAAVLQGRNSLKLGELGWWRIAVGLVLWVIFFRSHEWLFGG